MPTRKTIRKTPCPKSESCLKNRKTGNCNKPTPNKVPFKKLGYETLSEYKDTLPDADRHPVKYRLAMCADMKLAKRAPAFRNAADHIKARRRLHKRKTDFKYDSDSTDSEYESRRRRKKECNFDKYGFRTKSPASDSDTDSDFSLSDSDSDDDGEYKKKDCSKMGNKCYSTKTGKCMVPNSRTIWSNPRNQKHIGLTYSEFKDKLAGLSTTERSSVLCNMSRRRKDGTFPCDLDADNSMLLQTIQSRLPEFNPNDGSATKCEALVKYIMKHLQNQSVVHHTTIDSPLQIHTSDDKQSIAVPITYRGYEPRLLIISKTVVDLSLVRGSILTQGELKDTTAATAIPIYVYITTRPRM